MRLRSAFAAFPIVLLSAACTRETPPQPVEPSPAPVAPPTPPIGYACESGQSVTVAYPGTDTAQLTYRSRTYALRLVQSASGARYAGSGLEWWTATRNGSESATLSRLGPEENIGVAVLERCSRPASGQILPVPDASTQAAPGGVLPASTPCKGPQLKLSLAGSDAGAGNRVSIIAVQNVGARACHLTGYPGVALQDGQGGILSDIRLDQNPGSYFRNGEAPTPVELPPQGRAFFDLAWNVVPHEGQGERSCPPVARIRMTAPDDTSPVTLTQSLSPCGGRIKVSPFRPVAEPSPAA